MRDSIKRQITILSVGIVAFTMIIALLINGRFMEGYYIANKEEDLKNMYQMLNESVGSSVIYTESLEAMKRLAERANISFIVRDRSGNPVIGMMKEGEDELNSQLNGYLLDKQDGKILEQTSYYEIRKAKDIRSRTEYIEMWGSFDSGYHFLIRTPLDSIREGAKLSTRFLAYVGCIMIGVSCILVWYFSRKITDPIMELAMLSQKMANLDFNTKYTSGGDNEIGVLGDSFNRMSEKLEQTISQLKTANFELQKDIEQKEKQEERRKEFIGNVSHELKTPIALIQGYAEGLKEGIHDDPESMEFYCDVIIDEANKMNQMVKNLLTLNQLESGDDGLSMTRFDLAGLIRGVLQSCEILIQQAEAKVSLKMQETIYVWADEFKTEQVLRNYISNAIHHVEGERIIEIKVEETGEKAHISVFNTGKSIPQEDVERIWDKFYKVDKAHSREYGGNGIGLSIVKAIMESFHQKFGVENYDNGVAFWFELDMK